MSAERERQTLRCGEVAIDLDAQEVTVHGRPVTLTRTEYSLLRALVENMGKVMSKEQLLSQVWGYTYVGDTRVIPVHMGNLRNKLAQAGVSGYLHTLRGTGYKLQVPEVQSALHLNSDRSSFVGRKAQIAALEHSYRRTAAGHGASLLVWGEAGIGKTRLVEELVQREVGRDALVLWGRGAQDEGTPPFWPWTQVIRQWIRTDEQAAARIIEPLAADIAQLIPEFRRAGAGTPLTDRVDARARFRSFEAVASLLRVASVSRPVVIVLDDVHDADPSSMDLLEHLARSLRSMRVLLIVTCRDIDVPAADHLSRALAALAREGCDGHLPLAGFDREEVSQLMAVLCGREVPIDIAEAVWAHTDGNPFLVSQTTRLLLEQGGVDGGNGRVEFLRIPEGVHVTVRRRLESLGEDCRELLQVGAVVGRQFSLATVARVTGLEPAALVQALEGAVSARLVQTLPGDQKFRFHHNLTRETIYADLGMARRMRLHGEVGEALETVHAARLDDRLDEIAYHYRRAAPLGWSAKALEYGLRAGRAALARYAWEDARNHFEACLEIASTLADADPRPSAAEVEAWEALGDLAVIAQDYERARAAFERVMSRQPPVERVCRSRMRRKTAKTYLDQQALGPAMESLVAAVEELADLSADDNNDLWQEWLESRLQMLWASYYAGDVGRLEQLISEIQPVVPLRGSALQRTEFLRCLLFCTFVKQGHWSSQESVGIGDMLLQAARETGVLAEMALSEALVGNVWMAKPDASERDLAEAEQHCVTGLRLGERAADMHSQMLALAQLATLARLRHDVRAVRHWAELCAGRPQPGEWQDYVAFADAHRAWASWHEGAKAQAVQHGDRALATWAAVTPVMPFAWMARLVVLAIAIEEGRPHDALAHARELRGPYRHALPPLLGAALAEAQTAEDQGADDAMVAALERVIPAARQYGWL